MKRFDDTLERTWRFSGVVLLAARGSGKLSESGAVRVRLSAQCWFIMITGPRKKIKNKTRIISMLRLC